VPIKTDTTPLQRFSFKALGSVCEVQIYINTNETLSKIEKDCIAFIDIYQQKFTRYQENSLTSHINRSAGTGSPVRIDTETYQLLSYAQTLYEQSDGLFDITSGVLRRAWNFRSNQIPSNKAIDELLPLIGWPKVEWDSQQVYLPIRGMEIDFGGYVKEYIADKLAQALSEKGIKHGLVNLGGDIKIIGPHPSGKPWIVGIQHPRKPHKSIAKLPILRGGIASSGDYERFMVINNIRYCHLLNPKTGLSIQPHYCSVSVVADDCLIAGSLTSISLLKSNNEPNWLKEVGVPHLCIDHKLQLHGNLPLLQNTSA